MQQQSGTQQKQSAWQHLHVATSDMRRNISSSSSFELVHATPNSKDMLQQQQQP